MSPETTLKPPKEPRLVNACWGDNKTPYIVHAASMTDPEFALKLVKEFVKRGADVNLADPDGWTALSKSSENNTHTEVTKFLLKKGALIYKQTREDVLNSDGYSQGIKEGVERQPGNLNRAIKELGDESIIRKMLTDESVKGYSGRSTSVFSTLPQEMREHICSFLD